MNFQIDRNQHPHVHWLTTNSNLSKASFQWGTCYIGDKRIASFHMKTVDYVLGTVFNDVILKAKQMLEKMGDDAALRVRFLQSFNQRMVHLDNLFDPTHDPIAKEIVERNLTFYGIEAAEQSALLAQIKADVQAYLKDYSEDFTRDNVDILEKQLRPYFTKMKMEIRKRYDVKYIPFVFSQDDRKFLNLGSYENIDFLEMTCYSYAFLRVREARAIPYIKTNRSIFSNTADFLKLFADWGYQRLSPEQGDPCLQTNDLIAYITTPDEKEKKGITAPTITHLAIYQSNGRAVSKMGFCEPGISIHRLSDVMGNYGRHLLFFRKIQ